ncbi:MAG: DUF2786 domain-containing protein [Verrucomicrobiaceae bacterium]|nr:MAG: DUF2786 domain-containing protein [Verrucomicrobiaceae bacterium]
MTQQSDALANVKARIQKLMARTVENNCTEAEAMAAAAKVGELLSEYNLTMNEVDVRAARCVTMEVFSGGINRNELWHVAFNIGRFTGCEVWFRGGKYYYFGQEQDAQMSIYLFDMIRTAIRTEWATFKRTATYRWANSQKTASNSFRQGMARRIGTRLSEMQRANEEAVRLQEVELRSKAREQGAIAFEQANEERARIVLEFTTLLARGVPLNDDQSMQMWQFQAERMAAAEKAVGGSSLVVLKNTLVKEEFAATGIVIKPEAAPKLRKDVDAFSAGVRAGEKVNLSRPIEKSTVTGLLA